MDPKELANRLLEAQVDFVVGELTGKRLARVIARDVDELLALAAELTLADVLDADAAKGVLRRIVEGLGDNTLMADIGTALADAIYDLPASEDYILGQVVERDRVDALVVKLLDMHQLHERAMDRMAQSPLLATVAARFVGKIVSDFVGQQRQMAERLPGARSLFSFGQSAASKVLGTSVLGDSADKGAKLAIRQTNKAAREVLKDAPLRGAAMEIWDLHADAPISDLREYLTKEDLRDLVALMHEVVASGRSSDFAGEVIDVCVDAVLERYGARDLATMLRELGLTRARIVADLQELLSPAIDAARADGRLADLVRVRFKPFFASRKVRAILADA